MRAAQAVCGGLLGAGWLTLAFLAPALPADAASPAPDDTSTGDLVLPLAVLLAAVALAAYTYIRRRRRQATRTTPGGAAPDAVPLDELDRRARRALVETDDCIRASREELACAVRQLGPEALGGCATALAAAEGELAAAFHARQQADEGHGDTRELLTSVVTHCAAAGRRLDAAAAGFDQLRALERTVAEEVGRTQSRFRELAARVTEVEALLGGLRARYAPTAVLPATGALEQAKDRLVFTTVQLNRAHQELDRGESRTAITHLRAAEGAVEQVAVLTAAVQRHATELAAAERLLPAALETAEAEVTAAAPGPATAPGGGATVPGVAPPEPARGDLPGRVAVGEAVVKAVRRETGIGGAETESDGSEGSEGEVSGDRFDRFVAPYDPVDALRRLESALAGIDAATRRVPDGDHALVRLERALLTARGTTAAATDFVTTHRGAVGCAARTRLAAAQRLLDRAEGAKGPEAAQATPTSDAQATSAADTLADARRADSLAREAASLAERDVRAYGTPYGGATGGAAGASGAVLGGILLATAPATATDPAHGEPPHTTGGGPPSFGGPATRSRRGGGALFGAGPPPETAP